MPILAKREKSLMSIQNLLLGFLGCVLMALFKSEIGVWGCYLLNNECGKYFLWVVFGVFGLEIRDGRIVYVYFRALTKPQHAECV
jgi:hypothetical protein